VPPPATGRGPGLFAPLPPLSRQSPYMGFHNTNRRHLSISQLLYYWPWHYRLSDGFLLASFPKPQMSLRTEARGQAIRLAGFSANRELAQSGCTAREGQRSENAGVAAEARRNDVVVYLVRCLISVYITS
jgi:hypothetical protein